MQAVSIRSQEGRECSISTVSAIGDKPDEIYQALEVSYRTSPDFEDILDIYSIEDIFLLKDTIDIFISSNNLQDPMKKSNKTQKSKINTQEHPVPRYCFVLEGYLKGWVPADAPGSGTILKTSQEIADELEDMVGIDTFTIASVMSQLGFRAHYDAAGPHGWMMRRDPSAVHTIRPAVPEED